MEPEVVSQKQIRLLHRNTFTCACRQIQPIEKGARVAALTIAFTCRQIEPEVLGLSAVLAHPRLGVRRDLAAAVHVLQVVGVLAHC